MMKFGLVVAAMLALPCMSVASGQDCDNPALAVGGNSSFTIELKGGAPSYDGDLVTFTYEVCKDGGKAALSHWMFAPDINCYSDDEFGNPYTLADLVVDATLQTWDTDTEQWVGEDLDVVVGFDPTTGLNGIKFDDLDPNDDCHRYTITFDASKLDPAFTLCAGCIQAATKAGNESIVPPKKGALTLPGEAYILGPVCCLKGECDEETAFGGESSGAGKAWWFYYDISGEFEQTIYAGQEIPIGTVSIENDDDGFTFTITLENGWKLQNVSESVKIQGYNILPGKRPAAGLFSTYKGTELTKSVPASAYDYYVIHLDVEKCN
jgi:hypothetical protein